MSIRKTHCRFVILAGLSIATAATGAGADEKRRVVILSDISNEPDDQMSLVRFLTYANEFDVEGLIATTSCWRRDDPIVLNHQFTYHHEIPGNSVVHSS